MKEILPIILLLLVLIVVFVKNTRNYGNDVFKDIPKQYNLFHEQEGVTIYSSWIINQGSASALVFKLINKNKYPVVVNWMGPKWYTKGKDDSNTLTYLYHAKLRNQRELTTLPKCFRMNQITFTIGPPKVNGNQVS
jgi:hypothetical protein